MKMLCAHRAVVTTLTLLAGCLLSQAAVAGSTQIEFVWEGDAGYSAVGQMVYADTASLIEINLDNNFMPHPDVEAMSIRFFDPASVELFATDLIVNGTGVYDWLTFTYDAPSMQFQGFFDLGSDYRGGDLYLAGTIGGSAWLIESQNPEPVDVSAANSQLLVALPLSDGSGFDASRFVSTPTPGAFAAGSLCLQVLAVRRRRGV